MKMYLVHHSNAADAGWHGCDDESQRPLTDKGYEKIGRIASGLKALHIKPDCIVSSPYRHARQTAQLLAIGLNYTQTLFFNETLAPGGRAEDILCEINDKYMADCLILVSHEPCISGLIGSLIVDNPAISIHIKNGGVCCLSSEDLCVERKAVLEWLLTPKLLSKLS